MAEAVGERPGLILALETARAWGARPTEYLEQWSDRDRALAESLLQHERSICPCGCGQPAVMSQNPETAGGYWEVHEVICYARQEMALAEKQAGENEDLGTMRYVSLKPDFKPGVRQ